MDTINWCNLKDMGFVGPNFTWLYQTTDGVQIQERLDRVLAAIGWLELFLAAKLFHLTSDFGQLSFYPCTWKGEPISEKWDKFFGLSQCG